LDWPTCLLIGASDGIGLALGQLLQARGARLIVSARRSALLQERFPAQEVTKQPLDVNEPMAVTRAMQNLMELGLVPDVVIWMVGQYEPSPLIDFDPQKAKSVIQTNLLAAYDGLAGVLPEWLKPKGPAASNQQPRPHWVFVSSVAGYRGLPMAADYGASKAGLSYLAQVAHMELKPKGIDVSLVCPGFVATRLTAKNSFAMPAVRVK